MDSKLDVLDSNTHLLREIRFHERNIKDDSCVKGYNETDLSGDEIAAFLSKIQNKYTDNAEQKHLNQLYDIGILIVNKNFNHHKIVQKITKIIEERSQDPIKKIRDYKRHHLIEALKKGIEDGLSDEYRFAYDSSNKYVFNSERLKKRAYIDSVLNSFE